MTQIDILEGQEAIDLWLQGKDAWNQWAEENPEADVSFAGVDFGQFNLREISFKEFVFPEGVVSFEKCKFQQTRVNFSETIFYSKYITFTKSIFEDREVMFFKSEIHNGDISFFGSVFNNSSIYFSNLKIKNGSFYFESASITESTINFRSTCIDTGSLNFDCATFSNTFVNLAHVRINSEDLSFTKINIQGISKFILFNIYIEHQFLFLIDKKKSIGKIEEFSLRNSALSGSVTIYASFDCIPDLCGSKTSHHVDLGKLIITPSAYETLDENEDFTEKASKLCRLKEIAENNKDHGAALRFHAAERRTIRYSRTYPWFSRAIDHFFDMTTEYGQNIETPSRFLSGIFLYFILLYDCLAKTPSLQESALLSLSSMLPFLPVSRSVRQDAIQQLFGDNPEWCIDLLFLTQGALSFLFLFLLGLGLRNRFRL